MTLSVENQVKTLGAFEDKLVPGAVKTAMKESGAKSNELWRVPYDAIKVRPGYNPRIVTPQLEAHIVEVTSSIMLNGFYDDKPLGVSIAVEDGVQVIYLEDGHIRYAAAGRAITDGSPLKTLPVVAVPRSFDEVDRLVHMVRSNNDGLPFSPLEMGIVVQRLQKFGLEEGVIAQRLNVTITRIRQLETLISSPTAIRELVKNGDISATLAIETVQQQGSEAASILGEAVQSAKTTGKRATAKTVKKVAAERKKPSMSKKALEVKSIKAQKKNAVDGFDVLWRIVKKHKRDIDEKLVAEAEALFLRCGVVED